MSTVPVIPENAPFTADQRAWLNGFFAGIFSRAATAPAGAGPAAAPALTPLTILFGSQTGTAEGLARKAAKEAGKRGFAPAILDMAAVGLDRLASEKNLLVITSTYGDGEPPDNAKALHAALQTATGPTLANLRYSVCALGDTNYAQFCRSGKDFDTWLEKLGATRTTPRTDCDLDYDAPFTAWLDAALGAFGPGPGPATANDTTTAPASGVTPTEPAFSRQNPFPAAVLAVRCLNAPGSAKEVNHVEFSLEGSNLAYEAGDALGVVPHNCPELVEELLAALGYDGEEAVPAPDGTTTSLRHALRVHYDLAKPTDGFNARFSAPASAAGGAAVATAALPHVLDIVLARPETRPAPAEFVTLLRRIQPRLYSISSSPRAHPGQVHLTVGAVRYDLAGRPRKGVCSTFLAERALAAGKVGVFVHRNPAFRLPADGTTPVIMVGPGTGIAPFRAFLEDRQAAGAPGRNWLFFGDQRESTDFLYRDELTALHQAGVLTRLDLAWSRDQSAKVYVQNRLLEHAGDLFAWLEAGAHFYVCGDAARMAKDVDAALHRLVATAGGKSPEDAVAYVQSLRAAKRYQRDVY